MSGANRLIAICLILLGLTILVRTLAIAERAYAVLSPPPIAGDNSRPVLAALANPAAPHDSPIMDAQPVILPIKNPASVEGDPAHGVAGNPSDAGSPAKGQKPQQVSSEGHRKKVAQRRYHRFARSGSGFQAWPLWWY